MLKTRFYILRYKFLGGVDYVCVGIFTNDSEPLVSRLKNLQYSELVNKLASINLF